MISQMRRAHDSIGNKSWSIFAGNCPLTEAQFGKRAHEIENTRLGVRRGNQFEEVEITRWIEKMSAQELFPE